MHSFIDTFISTYLYTYEVVVRLVEVRSINYLMPKGGIKLTIRKVSVKSHVENKLHVDDLNWLYWTCWTSHSEHYLVEEELGVVAPGSSKYSHCDGVYDEIHSINHPLS